MIQDSIYYSLLIICLAVSICNELARQNYFWLYFICVLLYECLFLFKLIEIEIYASSAVFYSLFFVNVYLKELFNKGYLIKTIINVIVLILAIYLYPKKGYSIDLGIMMTFIYIVLGMSWLFTEFKANNIQIRLVDKQFFWISVSLLLWSVFFLFRLTPMNLFDQVDVGFLRTLNTIFQWVTIVSYVIFGKGLLCKS